MRKLLYCMAGRIEMVWRWMIVYLKLEKVFLWERGESWSVRKREEQGCEDVGGFMYFVP